jgi:hypothetical protein
MPKRHIFFRKVFRNEIVEVIEKIIESIDSIIFSIKPETNGSKFPFVGRPRFELGTSGEEENHRYH